MYPVSHIHKHKHTHTHARVDNLYGKVAERRAAESLIEITRPRNVRFYVDRYHIC